MGRRKRVIGGAVEDGEEEGVKGNLEVEVKLQESGCQVLARLTKNAAYASSRCTPD